MANKNVQIPMEMFVKIFRYFHFDDYDQEEEIKKYLIEKLDKLENHQLYSQYKTDNDENARQKYLDKIGMRDSFRWSKNYNPYDPPSS